MAGMIGKTTARKGPHPRKPEMLDEWGYPSGMVWCPMKMSGMALMKCAEMQKRLGCGTLRQFKTLATTSPDKAPIHWPWLRRGRECRARAGDKEVRELRVALSPLKLVKKGGENRRAGACPHCGERKALGARQCRRCWRCAVEKL